MTSIKTVFPLILGIAVFAIVATGNLSQVRAVGRSDKLSPEEVLAKNLDSIGSAESRAATKSRIIMGSAVATIRIGGSGTSRGQAVMASIDEKSLMGIIFGASQEYSNEKLAFDGKRVTFGELQPGVRTNLGGFLLNHEVLLKEGFLGGELSSAWPLYDLQARNPKLSSGGEKKVEGKQCYVVKYEPRKGSNLSIRLYFDTATFHHVRSEYEQVFPPPPVTRPEDAASQKETRLRLSEDFSEFKVENGLTLPHNYKIQLTFETSNNPLVQDWTLELTKFYFNQKIQDSQFDVTSSPPAAR